MKRFAIVAAVLLAAGVAGVAPHALSQGKSDKPHKLVLQVSQGEPAYVTQVLNNANNVVKHYGLDNVTVEIVAYGAGLDAFMKGSPFAPRLQSLYAGGNVKYGICENTMTNRKIAKADLIQEDYVQKGYVTSGVVRIMELQEAGYSYVRP